MRRMNALDLFILALLSLFVCGVAHADTAFIQNMVSDGFEGPHHVMVADLDGDLDNDIVACAYDAGDILWWENDGTASFTPHTLVLNNFRGAHQCVVADLDDDNDQDVVAVAFEQNQIDWWENLGNQTFSRHTVAGGFDNAACVFVIDIDDDGDQDILAASFFEDTIALFENDGSESFSRSNLVTGLNGAQWVWAGDLDGDDDADLAAVGFHDHMLAWWENDGGGTFSNHIISVDFDGPSMVTAVDLDGDDDFDLINTYFEDGRMFWWENDGSGQFTRHQVDFDLSGGSMAVAGDLDQDGDIDLAGTAFTGDQVYWYENTGNGNFTRRLVGDGIFSPLGLGMGDLDGDLKPDLVATSYIDDTVYWFKNGTEKSFTIVAGPGPGAANEPRVKGFTISGVWNGITDFLAYAAGGFGVNVAAGDIDGDGQMEILTGPGPGRSYGPHVRAFRLNGQPMSAVSYLAYGTNKYGVNVACGDVNGDGNDEIITGAGPGAVFGPHVRGWNFDGSTVMPIAGISYFAYGTNKYGVNVACGDVDGDGIDEILTGAGPGAVFGPHVRGWNYDGSGSAMPIPGISFLAYGTNKYGVNVGCGDVDGDGFSEILTAPGPGDMFSSHVRGFNYDNGSLTAISGISFVAYSGWLRGANLYGVDLDNDGFDEILTGPGPADDNTALVKGWNYDNDTLEAIDGVAFDAFDNTSFFYGVNVTGAGS